MLLNLLECKELIQINNISALLIIYPLGFRGEKKIRPCKV